MKKLTIFLAFLLFVGFQAAAQMQITGKVTGAEDGLSIPGVSVVVKESPTIGTTTNVDGEYSLTVPNNTQTLVFSFVGMKTMEVAVNGRSVIDTQLEAEVLEMDEVVVTALGISREKKSLGYAMQKVDGDDLSQVKGDNFVSSISGKVSGVQIKTNGNMGGSTNIVIRGSSSLTGNNQALFVVDGVPVSNSNTNNLGQTTGRNGYDYGNAVSDINPSDIESMSVLKGAAATALYGSRAANGVIIITTKKGEKHKTLGVTYSGNVTLSKMDKSTFPTYQQNYGGGYGSYYSDGDHPGLVEKDVTGDKVDDLSVPFGEDASYGEKFDPSLMVYQWDAFVPESPNYGKATPWVAGANGPETFFKTGVSYTNTIDVSGGTDRGTYRFGYTNLNQTGIFPNSELKRNNYTFTGSYDILDNLKITTSANYINTYGKGRNSTGYSDNILSSFRQWMQINTDYKELEEMYHATGRNVTWNRNAYNDASPAYWDNPYWVRYENYETDDRGRLVGYAQLDWKINDYINIMGRAAVDTYNELQEERKAVGSMGGQFGVNRPSVTSGYSRYSRKFTESNFDLMARFNKNITDNFNINGLLGINIRKQEMDRVFVSTNGGLAVPKVYALSNSVSALLPPEERYEKEQVNGYFASVSLGYKNFLYLDATGRIDQSSTLPVDNNTYFYPSVSGSFIFSNLVDVSWMELGKIRLNYAEVGKDAPFASINDTYFLQPTFNSNAIATVANTKNNSDLKPERTKSIEAGLEMNFFKNRLGFDFAYYKTNSVDQIMNVAVSRASGNAFKFVNAGEIQNKGYELSLFATPVKMSNFKWDVNLNWSKNDNEVVSLAEGIDNYQLAGLQGGVTINARVGEPFGTIQGNDYIYTDGKKTVGSNGYYLQTKESDKILGNINPDWMGGINNALTYKNITFSFLIDVQQGGSVFSLDQYYGMATGIYAVSDFTNDLGNPVRNDISDGGGAVLPGVYADGTTNNTRIAGNDYYAFGYVTNPSSGFIFDASYVKLREVVLTYNLPKSWMDKTFIAGASLSFVGSNLWIIAKDLPSADPEAGQSSGNIQGWQSGVMPTTRNYGFSLNLQF